MYFIIGFGAGIGALALAYVLVKVFQRRSLRKSLRYQLYLIRIPRAAVRKEKTDERELKSEIALTEQLFSAVVSAKDPCVFELAVHHVGEEIRFYISLPRSQSGNAIQHIQALWSGAQIEEAPEDYNVFAPTGAVAGAYLTLKEDFALPIRTYGDMNADTASAIFGGFAKIHQAGEGAALQIVMKSSSKEAKRRLTGYLESLKKGETLEKIIGHQFPFSAGEIGDALGMGAEKKKEEEKKIIVDEDAVKALEMKAGKPLFNLNIRIVASGADERRANEILDGITAGFTQFAAPRRNGFKAVKPRSMKNFVYDFVFRRFAGSYSVTLNSEEIASFFHLPVSTTDTPRVHWLKAKEAPPPVRLPAEGVLLGRTSFRGEAKPIYLTDADRARHVYMVGQTGTGKSTLLGNMILSDIEKGKGVAMIDPHGDLAENILSHIPESRKDDVVYFDPADTARPLGLNMIEWNFSRPEEKTFLVNEMQGIFNKLFPPETMGPMFEQYMRNGLLLLMEDMQNEPATLVEIPRVFTDAEFRKRKLARIQNPVVVDFWEREAVKAGGEASLANMTPYITSKFNNFISNDYMRPIIAQPKSAFNFRDAMDSGKIILVNLSKGRIGDINAGLLGMIVTGKILMAALSRADIKDAAGRRDFNLYIDEFQSFTTDSIASILSEARKYGLSLTMAHQFIAQLTEKIRDAVFGNVGSVVAFRVGVQDAEFLVKQFAPVFDENDLVNIDNLQAYVKLLINGETSRPFNIKIDTASWSKGDSARAEAVKQLSRTKYGADKAEVEAAMYKRLRE